VNDASLWGRGPPSPSLFLLPSARCRSVGWKTGHPSKRHENGQPVRHPMHCDRSRNWGGDFLRKKKLPKKRSQKKQGINFLSLKKTERKTESEIAEGSGSATPDI